MTTAVIEPRSRVETKHALLIGCGHSRERQVRFTTEPDTYLDPQYDLTTLDMNPEIGADVVWDMEDRPLPFEDEEFDEIAAFNVLEHWGKCGDWRAWFEEFAEYHRILKPEGRFISLTPLGEDRFADPGHTRFIAPNSFGFLNQAFYRHNLAEGRPITDYRWFWKLNFDIELMEVYKNGPGGIESHLAVILVKRDDHA